MRRPACRGPQWSSAVISDHQWSSVVISGHQSSSVVISRHQLPGCDDPPAEAAARCAHQRSSVVISRHQSSSVVISLTCRCSSSMRSCFALASCSACSASAAALASASCRSYLPSTGNQEPHQRGLHARVPCNQGLPSRVALKCCHLGFHRLCLESSYRDSMADACRQSEGNQRAIRAPCTETRWQTPAGLPPRPTGTPPPARPRAPY